jgi:hypothetical protein
MIGEPFRYLELLASDVAVIDGGDDLASQAGAPDGVEEADELPAPMAPRAAPDRLSAEEVGRGERDRYAAAPFVAGYRRAFAMRERQAGPRAVRRENLALLVDRRRDRLRGRTIAIVSEGRDANGLRHADRLALRSVLMSHPIVSTH